MAEQQILLTATTNKIISIINDNRIYLYVFNAFYTLISYPRDNKDKLIHTARFPVIIRLIFVFHSLYLGYLTFLFHRIQLMTGGFGSVGRAWVS